MKRTFQPNNRNKKKKHGFYINEYIYINIQKGSVLNKRRAKGRKKLCA